MDRHVRTSIPVALLTATSIGLVKREARASVCYFAFSIIAALFLMAGMAQAQTYQSSGCSNGCIATNAGSSPPYSLVGTLPATTASGHRLLAQVIESNCGDAYTTTGPAGWTQLVGSPVVADDGVGDDMQTSVWQIPAASATPAATWTQSNVSAGNCDYYLIRIDDRTNVGSIGPTGSTTSGASKVATLASASLTPDMSSSVLVTYFQTFSFGDISSVTGSPTLTQRWLDSVASTTFMGDYMGDLALSSTSPTSVYTVHNSGTDLMTSFSVILDPAATPTPTLTPSATSTGPTQTPTPSPTPTLTGTPSQTPAPTATPTSTPYPCLPPGQSNLFQRAPVVAGVPPIYGFNVGFDSAESYQPNLPNGLQPIAAGDRILVFYSMRGTGSTTIPNITVPSAFSLVSGQTVIPASAPADWLVFNIYQYVVPVGGALPPYTVNNCSGSPCWTLNTGWTPASPVNWAGYIIDQIGGFPLVIQQTANSGTSLVSNLVFPGYGFGTSTISFQNPTSAAGVLFGIESTTGGAVTFWAMASNDGLSIDVAPANTEGVDLTTSLYNISTAWEFTAWQSSMSDAVVGPIAPGPVNGLFGTGGCKFAAFQPTITPTATPSPTPTPPPVTSAAGLAILLRPCSTPSPTPPCPVPTPAAVGYPPAGGYPQCPNGQTTDCTISVLVGSNPAPLFDHWSQRQYMAVQNQGYIDNLATTTPVCCAISTQNAAAWSPATGCNGFLLAPGKNYEPWIFQTPQAVSRIPSGDISCVALNGCTVVTGLQE